MNYRYALAIVSLVSLANCGRSPQSCLDKGNRYFAAGKYEDAALQYRQAINKDPKMGEAYYRLGVNESRREKSADALAALDKAVEFMPEHQEAKNELAQVLLSQFLGDPRRPKNLYDRLSTLAEGLFAKDSESFTALRIKGYLAIAYSRPAEAVQWLRRAAQVKPDQPDIVSMLMQNLILDGNPAEGEQMALAFLKGVKSYGPLYDLLYSHYKSTNRLPEAERVLQSKMENNPGQSLFILQLAGHYRDYGKAPQMLELLGKLTQAPLEVGDFWVQSGALPQALDAYRRGLDRSPADKAVFRKRMAAVLLAQGKPDEATRLLEAALKEHPGDGEALASRASILMASGKSEEMRQASLEFKSLVENNLDNFEYRFSLARAYRQNGANAEARGQYGELIRRNPNHVGALRDLADMAIRSQQTDDALRYAEQLLAILPNDPAARLVRTAVWAMGGHYGKTRIELNKLMQQFPSLAEPKLQMGMLLVAEKRYGEAETWFQKYYQPGHGDIRLLRGLVALHMERRQPSKAFAAVEREYRRSPDAPGLAQLLAATASNTVELELAIEAAQRVAAKTPQAVEPLLQLGRLFHQKGDATQAAHHMRRASVLAPENGAAVAAHADILADIGRTPEAIAAYRRSLQLEPDNPAVKNNLAFQLATSGGDLKEAASLARSAAQNLPDNPAVADTLGLIYMKSGNVDSAIRIFRGTVEKDAANSTYRLHLAMALIEKSDSAAARIELERALQTAPAQPVRGRIEDLLRRLTGKS